jgi:hypothetical protein
MRNAGKILYGKPEKKSIFVRPRCRLENNSKRGLKK